LPSTTPPLYSCRCQACDCPDSTTHASKVCWDCREATDELGHPGPPPGEGLQLLEVVDVEVPRGTPGAVAVAVVVVDHDPDGEPVAAVA